MAPFSLVRDLRERGYPGGRHTALSQRACGGTLTVAMADRSIGGAGVGLSGHHRPASIKVMLQRTQEIWDEQDRHRGNRFRLFTAVSDAFTPTSALYPGSFADIAPSFLIDDVTYVDGDLRARQFFADDAVDQLIAERSRGTTAHWRFIHGDYRRALPSPTRTSTCSSRCMPAPCHSTAAAICAP